MWIPRTYVLARALQQNVVRALAWADCEGTVREFVVSVWRACRWAAWLLVWGLTACASIPAQSYGVAHLRFKGVRALDSEALRVCLATEQRPKLTLGLSALREPRCGQPPFDRSRVALRLFAWPWTDWPVYDDAVFKLDLDRITRWYRARGYYDARIMGVQFTPPAAATSDIATCGKRGCELDLTVSVEEGQPVRIRSLGFQGGDSLQEPLRQRLARIVPLQKGEIFDEARYGAARERLLRELRDHGYARAEVRGDVRVHTDARRVDLTFLLVPGRIYRIGRISVRSVTSIPETPILAAARLKPDTLYRESALEDAERAIYALGAFTNVRVQGEPQEGSEWVDVVIRVEPRKRSAWMLGGGVMSGVLSSGVIAPEWVSVPQWDIHLSASYEHRNFLGGLRRLRIEERPRMIFLGIFPSIPADSPRFGNTFRVIFSQPSVIEARTNLFSEARWDQGPDPFLLFFRADIKLSVGLERSFYRQRLQAAVAAHQDFVIVSKHQPIAIEVPSSYVLPFLEQRMSLDLRDNSVEPTRGGYFSMGAHEAFQLGRSWNYLRLLPEARGYAPLGLGVVLAARFAIGWLQIFSASPRLDPQSQQLGPIDYRLRGGGAQSNRGFLPGQLGDGVQGGTRRWESSLELRIPLTKSLTVAAFTDVGDVNYPSFRFDHLNTAVGGGVRYRTPVGPIRLDVGYRPPSLQTTNGSPGDDSTMHIFGRNFMGAVNLTVGEAF